jgi:uncharacterized membrane protein
MVMKVNGHDVWELTESWLTMSNDDFYILYGFNWVPPNWMKSRIKDKLLKKEKEKQKNDLYGCNTPLGPQSYDQEKRFFKPR